MKWINYASADPKQLIRLFYPADFSKTLCSNEALTPFFICWSICAKAKCEKSLIVFRLIEKRERANENKGFFVPVCFMTTAGGRKRRRKEDSTVEMEMRKVRGNEGTEEGEEIH
jgi:hypothetical protein